MARSPASLRRQIGSAGDLQSVVRAMKAQAAASIGQYEKSVAALGGYARTIELGLGACFRHRAPLRPAPARHRAGHGRVVRAVVFGSDQGLVGRFNDIVLDHARASLASRASTASERPAQVWAVGDRVREGLAESGMPVLGSFAVPGSVQAVAALVGQVLTSVTGQGDADEVDEHADAGGELHLFYNRPTVGSAYQPVGQRLLPLDDAWRRGLAAQPWPTHMLPEVFDSERGEATGQGVQTLRALIREYLFVSIFRACAESLASENASRLAAMDRADRNIDTLLEALHGSFHRLRQSVIDEELSDVVSGFRALSHEGRGP